MKTATSTLGIYLQLRLKQALRLLKGIGLFRSLFLLTVLILLFYILIKVGNKWIIPTGTILGLIFYHNERKDKEFLSIQTKQIISFLRMEYILLGLPFILIELSKGYLFEAGGILTVSLCLPFLRTVKWRSHAIPLPFLYKGGIEYLRMFRQYGWLYLLLFSVTLIGALHNNIRIGKVCLLIWGVVQATAFTSIPHRQELTFFQKYSAFQKYLLRSSAWNVMITCLPVAGIILSFSPTWENILYSIFVIIGSTLYLWNIGMFRQVCSSSLGIAIYQLIIPIPLFFCSCFVPFLLIPFVVVNGALSYFVKNELKNIWN